MKKVDGTSILEQIHLFCGPIVQLIRKQGKTEAETEKDRDKDNMLRRLNICYIFEKQWVQGF